jgi:hypothetical protein
MKNKMTRYLTMTLGCMLVMAMIGAQFFQSFTDRSESTVIKTEQTDATSESKDQVAYISLPSYSLPSPVHVQINLDFHCLFEILFEDRLENNPSANPPDFAQKFLITLFRVIISPNAP